MARKLIFLLALFGVGIATWRNIEGASESEQVIKSSSSAELSDKEESHSQTTSSVAKVEGSLRWESLFENVRNLERHDQEKLTKLYSQSAQMILENEEWFFNELQKSLPIFYRAPLEEGFFAVGSWIRASRNPVRIVVTLWKNKPPQDGELVDAHHPQLTPRLRAEHIEAYALRELRKVISDLKLNSDQRETFTVELARHGSSEKSLNLAIEIFKTLSAFNELEILERSLGSRSERDQRIIRAAL